MGWLVVPITVAVCGLGRVGDGDVGVRRSILFTKVVR